MTLYESKPNFKTRCLVYLFVQFRLIVCLLFSLQHSKAFFWTFLYEITLFYGRKIWILAGCTWKINFLKLRKYCFRPSSKWHWVVYSLLYRIFRNSLDKHVSCFMTIKCSFFVLVWELSKLWSNPLFILYDSICSNLKSEDFRVYD